MLSTIPVAKREASKRIKEWLKKNYQLDAPFTNTTQAGALGPSKAWKRFSSALKNHFREIRHEETHSTDTNPATRDEGKSPFVVVI